MFTETLYEQPTFHLRMGSAPRANKLPRNTMIPIVNFPAPSFWTNMPPRVIHKPNIWPLRKLKAIQ
jgi:hypothetical protein